MKCPECNSTSQVLETRPAHNGVRRRRKCKQGHVFSSLEVFCGVIGCGNLPPDVIVLPTVRATSKQGTALRRRRSSLFALDQLRGHDLVTDSAGRSQTAEGTPASSGSNGKKS